MADSYENAVSLYDRLRRGFNFVNTLPNEIIAQEIKNMYPEQKNRVFTHSDDYDYSGNALIVALGYSNRPDEDGNQEYEVEISCMDVYDTETDPVEINMYFSPNGESYRMPEDATSKQIEGLADTLSKFTEND
jgi:hypothetical protein